MINSNRLAFKSTPYLKTTLQYKLKKLGIAMSGDKVSIGDFLLMLQLTLDITVYITTPTKEGEPFTFYVIDNTLNVCFLETTVIQNLTELQLNMICHKIITWLLYKFKLSEIPENVSNFRFNAKALEELKNHIKK